MKSKERSPLSGVVRVLFVGDEPTGRAGRLESEFATDVDEAGEHLAAGEFDCVVAAHEPPTLDAFDLLAAVRERGGLPVVLLVGPDDRDVVPTALAEGATEYVLTDGEPDAESLSTRIEVAVDRYREREQAAAHERDRIETLYRINDVVRDIDQAVVGASTREDIEQAVCERLAATDAYTFAWVGTRDVGSNEIRPRASAGAGGDYLQSITVTFDDEGTGLGPAGRAVRTHEVHVVDDIAADASFEPWRQVALDHGFRSRAAIPLVYGESLYGVVNVYADSPTAFDDVDTTVLAELGETIGHAINAVESKKSLITDSVVQLEFRVHDSDHFLAHASERTGCAVTLEGTITQSDGSTLQYCTVSGARPEQIRDFAERSDQITHVRLISTGDEASVFELKFTGQSIIPALADHGASLQTVTADDGELTVIAELAREADIRIVVEAFMSAFPDSELVAQRESDRPVQTTQEFRSKLERTLTAKQRAALRASYFAGFFEWPRESTGEEVADGLGISPSTYHQHLRIGEKKLLEAFFDEG